MKNIKTITIGIPAFNESKNIIKLLKQIVAQSTSGFIIKKIIISDDASLDNTVVLVKKFAKNNKSISIITNNKRAGIARGLNQITSNSLTDIVVTLDADIEIKDKYFIQKLIEPITTKQADLVSSAIKEKDSKNYYQKVLILSMRIKNLVFNTYLEGNNLYTCHGLARAYSKKMYKKIKFPFSIGNDMYSYLWCIKNKMNYVYSPKAIATYKLPDNYSDHKKQSMRYYNSFDEQKKYFSKSLIAKELRIPPSFIIKNLGKIVTEIAKHPVESITYIFIQLTTKVFSLTNDKKQTWSIASSTK